MRFLFFITIVVLCCEASQLVAQELSDAQLKELMRVYYRDFAEDLKFMLDEDKEPLETPDKPVLTWWSAEGVSFSSGDVFVWERHGRPELIACIGSSASHLGPAFRNYFQEYHLLGERTVQPTQLKTLGRWMPRDGIKLRPALAASKPKKSARLRLAQMRGIARSDFKSFMKYDGEKDEEPLRIMSQPFYRYDAEALAEHQDKVVDGALFAFISSAGTDPELILLLECHNVDGKLQWMYAPIRFTHRKLRLEHQGKSAWAVERWDSSPSDAYIVGNIESRRLADVLERFRDRLK